MKSKFLLLVGVLFAVGSVLSGCKDNPNPDPYPDTLKQFSAEAASGANAINSNGGTRTIAFYSPVTWTAAVTTSDGGDWVKLEPASGPVGTCSVTVTAAKNESKDKTRSATVTITAGAGNADLHDRAALSAHFRRDECRQQGHLPSGPKAKPLC
ncbi:MAG: BACON domain-containing protein [Alistipes indistinctus]